MESEEHRKNGGHPCVAYTNYLYDLKKDEDKKFDEALNRLSAKPMPESRKPGYNEESSGLSIPVRLNTDKKSSNKLVSLLLSPFVFVYDLILKIMDYLIIKPLTWLFEEFGTFIVNLTESFAYFTTALWSFVKILLAIGALYFLITWLADSQIIDSVSKSLNSSLFIISSLGGKSCSATLNSGECWENNQPWYCNDGNLTERPDICGCPSYLRFYNNTCILKYNCSDGTLDPDCSKNQPYQCIKGKLIENPELCGCPEDYLIDNVTKTCKKIERCEDGTIYGQCSMNKPLFCSNGLLIENASTCGCSTDLVQSGDTCVSRYETNPIVTSGTYVVRGQKGTVQFVAYGGLNDYLAIQSRYVTCGSSGCSEEETLRKSIDKQINDGLQNRYLSGLIEQIKNKTANKDNQARIAISYVQHIPYDWGAYETGIIDQRYPYEVIYDNKGVCMEKARLLAFLLIGLGYNVSMIEFDNHEAVGIKCPIQYSYMDTGYCFIESTAPSIITDSNGEYVGVGKLSSPNYIIPLSGGSSFYSVEEEYNDARLYHSILQQSESSGGYLDGYSYVQWQSLVTKYDIQIS